MMKAAGFIFALYCVLPAWGDNVTSKRVVDVGDAKAVVFEETVSPDGRYAIGWTIRLRHKNAKPVNWSLWNPDDPSSLLDAYVSYLPDQISEKDDYELVNCALDLKGRHLLVLPTDDPDYPQKNRGYVVAAWTPPGKGPQYGLVESDARFSTENLWLITVDASGMHQIDLAHALNKAIEPIIAEKRPLARNAYETSFAITPDESGNVPQLEFRGSTVVFPFISDIPKSTEDYSEVNGTVTVKLPEGTILKAVSTTLRDDPFKDKPELAKADQQLNEIYNELSQKLNTTEREDLKKEQLAWIDQRNLAATQALDASRADSSAHDVRVARDKSLIRSTQKRVTELKTRLDALK